MAAAAATASAPTRLCGVAGSLEKIREFGNASI
jgi:hypothetical protein